MGLVFGYLYKRWGRVDAAGRRARRSSTWSASSGTPWWPPTPTGSEPGPVRAPRSRRGGSDAGSEVRAGRDRRMRIGVFGATGQVGRSCAPCWSSATSPSTRCASSEIVVEDTATADFAGPRHRAVLRRRHQLEEYAPKFAAAGAVVIDNSSAWRMDPDVPLCRQRGQPHELVNPPKGIIANPNCTTMAAMPVLKPLHDEAGLTAHRRHLPGGQRWRARRCRRARQAGREVWPTPRALAYDGERVEFPEPTKFVASPSPSTCCPRRQASSTTAPGDRRGAEAAQREPQDPRIPGPAVSGHVRAGAGVHRPLAQRSTPSSSGPSRPSGAASCWPRPGSCSCSTCPRRWRPPARTRVRRPHPPGPVDSMTGDGLVLFVSERQPAQGRRAQRRPDRRAAEIAPHLAPGPS
jgi:hypothetical protein